ncbi:hypothetical protein K9L05_00460 [Candidatus Babeliales bacterium]|nr:hypothetical protein [Candidatus Babeliales bacterium]
MFKNFNKKAFSLIELLLYIASVSVFSLLILNYFSSVQNKLIIDSKKDDLIIQNSIVLDLL